MMHPAQAFGFEWDEDNEEHLASHGITPWEVEQVFLNGPVWVPNRKDRSGAWKMLGWTDGGRALTIILVVIEAAKTPGMLRAFTGWDATAGERTRYLRNRGGR